MLGVIHAFHLGDPAPGVALLTMPAQQGDPVAQRTLGYLIQHGMGATPDQDRAVQLYRAAAEAGDGIAAFNLGMLCGESDEALRWLRRAADAGVSEAYPWLGDKLSQRDLDEQALRWYVLGAQAGQAGSMFAAACWYRDGFGSPVDLVQALRWYLAMLEVGNGDGVHHAHHIVAMMADTHSGPCASDPTHVDARSPTRSPTNPEPMVPSSATPVRESQMIQSRPVNGQNGSPNCVSPDPCQTGPNARRHARRGTGPGTPEVQVTLEWSHDAGRAVIVDHYDHLLRSCKADPRRRHMHSRHGFAQYQPARRPQRLGRYVPSGPDQHGSSQRGRWAAIGAAL